MWPGHSETPFHHGGGGKRIQQISDKQINTKLGKLATSKKSTLGRFDRFLLFNQNICS